MTEPELMAALYRRFEPPTYALLEQVRNGTGRQRETRTADALAMCLWPSRGLELHGIEIKVSRTDWIKELKNPAKAEEIARFCDRWWLCVSDAKIVQDGELPKTWGLLIPKGKNLIAKVEAPELTPQPITRAFLAAILRRAMAVVTPAARIEEVRKSAYEQGSKAGHDLGLAAGRREYGPDRTKELRDRIQRFQEASGIDIGDKWSAGDIGAAVKRLHSMRYILPNGHGAQLRKLADELDKLRDELAWLKLDKAEAQNLDLGSPMP